MDRRDFLRISSLGIAALGLEGCGSAAKLGVTKDDKYSIVILGDTHYDTEPVEVYHSLYSEPVQWLNDVQRAEFARNGQMWRERCPRLLKRAACLVDDSTRMVLQVGDLIQGDCGTAEVHRKMLSDVMDSFKTTLGGLPFVTVAGNHDIRGNYTPDGKYDRWGTGAEKVYGSYMPARMSEELGIDVPGVNFMFKVGDDAFLAIDFNTPDDTAIERMLKESEGARNTFVLIHSPLIPYDGSSCRWILHGQDTQEHTAARRHLRAEFARRNAIVLCGHTHRTELADWYGDGGRITQMTMNSVFASENDGVYVPLFDGPEHYGEIRKNIHNGPDGGSLPDESALFEEYRSGMTRYLVADSAGSYKMFVDGRHVFIDFYAGDSSLRSQRFQLR